MLFTLLAVLLLGSAAKAQTIHYVTPTGDNPATGNQWEVAGTVKSLSQALTDAVAGDQIWVLGFEQITDPSQLYVAPEGGFTVKSGVKLYGGFRGTERTIDERPTLGKAPYFTYRSVLSGDINCDDTVDEINYVYPANETREDNAKHVLSLNMVPTQQSGNNNTYPTVVNGFTVIGGNATDFGGGIYVYGSNAGGGAYQIEKCFLLNNYAELGGGAIYVSADVKATSTESRIVDCVVYNNLAGVRSGSENLGGGINIAGSGTIVNSSIFNNEGGGVRLSSSAKAVNLTIARNTVMGIEGGVVSNSVIWGNSKVQNPTATSFENCASDNANVTGIDCISISSESNGSNGPLFEAPSVFTSFDRDFDWRRTAYPTWSWGILEGSALIDKGNDVVYTGLPSTDLAGETRKKGTIDIGAYEFQHLDASRIRYVKVGGTGDGSSWGNASGDLQKMIDELATIDAPGEVWVAAGRYRPTTQIIEGVQYAASFRMRDGIDVYGGFAGTEPSKADREKGSMPWIYTKETILLGADYEDGSATWGNDQWNVISSTRHVVWFAPMSGEVKFKYTTVLDGVTIKGGAANGGEGLADFATDKGGGVYMGLNAILQNCIVTENTAKGDGGGVYANGDGADASSANAKGGRVVGCLVYNNSSVEDGGGVFVKNAGLVLRSMITNNSAMNGAGVYLDKNAENHPEYLILSTSVVSNNTATGNGAVYCNESGVLLQNTIVNNDCPSTVDASNPNSSQTGGLYINKYAYVINSILWNNLINGLNIPMYALGATAENVRFYNNAISGSSNAVWNNIYQTSTLKLSDENSKEKALSPDFKPGYPAEKPNDEPEKVLSGVQSSWVPTYYWEPQQGSNLRAGGLTIGTFPDNVLVAPELDIAGTAFAQKPAVGAHAVDANGIDYNYDESNKYYDVFVDINYMETDGTGISWVQPYKSLNEVLAYFANDPKLNLTKETVVRVHVKEGDYWPRYAFTNLDPKTATLSIPALPNGAKFEIYGGYAAESDGTDLKNRFPTTYRTVIDGNHEGKNIDEGIYHCITVETGANVVLDGFHVINGYAAGTATLRYGAGMLVRDGATVEVRNSIFENNTAAEAAAIDARGATLTLTNCVVNNNTNTTESSSVVNANILTLNHVSVVNNIGVAPAKGTSSFAIGNSDGNTFTTFASVGADGAKNFANPTNMQGAALGFDTYYGGYSNFTPLTSSTDAGQLINKATGTPSSLTKDIAGNSRNLGGSADMGAYEANLPVNGTVFYVTKNGAGKMDGSSWENAIAGNMIYDVTNKTNVNISTADPRYIGFYDASVRPYGETSGASKLFFEHLNEQNLNTSNVNYSTETHDGVTHVTGANGINIRNNRQERYVGGLQYAVEQAAAAAAKDGQQRSVWVAGGTYTDYKGFVIRDKVNVLGGFPNEGTPGEDDRRPLISQYIPANETSVDLEKDKYETIIQIQATAPVTWNGNTPTAVSGLPSRTRKPVLFQPDVCLPTKSPSGRESSYSYWEWGRSWGDWSNHWMNEGYGNSVPGADENTSNTYRWENQEGGYVEYTGATWDGFTIRHGFYTDYKANRDGGAGVRMFRGVTLQNCVVTDNYISAGYVKDVDATRGAGIYCDGNNSKVVNCFVLRNANKSGESYGGGMYMILGTSYNTMVANNYAESNGGGIFIEDAMFYNNTVAYNRSTGTGGLHQWTASSGTTTTLKLYNTIFYGNTNQAIGVSAIGNFNGAWNCFVQSNTALSSDILNKLHSSNYGTNLASPFESTNAQSENNYRLNSSTWCLNNGAEDLGKDYLGNVVALPYTDVDFTDRIKDCAVDVGAYEKDNSENIGYEIKTTDGGATSYNFYVSEEGAGLRSGANPANAACEMKLQQILNRAGELASEHQDADVIVKVAEGEYNANTLSEANDPLSYTFIVPEGVILEGGYTETDKFVSRNPFNHETILSPVASVEGQNINGYHAVTFGKPAGESAFKQSVVDGVSLTGGKATSMVGEGNPKTQGGGAIVPAWGHIRNCRVYGNEAIQGGGLYLQPGALVSGTAVQSNSAEEGAGIFAIGTGASKELRAHVVSSTVTDNEATENGGGIYFADGGALFLNMVVWGNTASSDNNVSGPVYATFDDSKMEAASAANGNNFTTFFPFNYSFVERFELPSNMVNTSMTSDENLYFASSDRRLRAFSPLVNNGYSTTLQGYLATNWNIAASDMQGIVRIQDNINKIDVGAYAFLGGVIPEPKVGSYMAKLFVNQTTEFRVANTETLDLLVGRSFYTPLYHLDDALEYAKKAVDANPGAKIEIFVAQGTYKPTIRRMDAASGTVDQRQNSFVVPAGVNIYGGFSGKETYSYGLSSVSSEDGTSQSFTDITNSDISQYLTARETSDFNLNSINEPWELKNQTILSGDINASETVKNAYHVLYSSIKKEENGDITGQGTVTLDGLTVMDGETANELPLETKNNEIGRGGGLYSNGVNYIINRCRFLNNKGIRGNAAYVRGATATVIGSIFAGNSTVEGWEYPEQVPEPGAEVTAARIYGGAICMAASTGENTTLKAVNTLWANNETDGTGGAIGFAVNGGTSEVNLMNNTIVRNKAANGNGAIYAQSGTVTNTLVWGNESVKDASNVSDGIAVTYSAAEDLTPTEENKNITLAAANTSIDGPRFAQPSNAAGAAANDPMTKWNPSSINVLTDAGNGVLAAGKDIDAIGEATGAYKDWWTDNENSNWTNAVAYYATKFMRTDDGGQYYRYAGPRDEKGEQLDRTIDIGLYEYQYVTTFSNLDAVYVATTEAGNGSGDSWLNATSDLRGAIISMANPTGGQTSDKAVYIRDGEYASKQLLTGTAFPLNMDKDNADGMNGTSLTIKGSYNEAGVQDFSNPTVISSYPGVATERLINIATNNEPVFIEGILFNNATAGGDGIVSTGNNLKLARVAFRGNAGTGVSTSGNSLIYNALFADGGTGLNVGSGEVKVVNATFANNGTAIKGTASVFNSVSWNSGNGVATDETNCNAVLGNAVNDNIQNGPNFVDPNNENILLRDYSIRPSMMLLNKGDNSLYESNVGVDPTTDVDLTNGVRVVDNKIDVGAYEYAAPLSQILYVKSNVVGSDESGSSWTNAIADLQGAIDLASIYANVNTGATGYVFVHNNVSANNVRVAMPGVKAYGSMNDETGTGVTDILGKRSSILDLQRRSTINGLTVAGTGSVVDGFEVSGTVAVSSGMLSTSIVKPTGAVTVTGDGVLYNSFVDGAVNGKAVNVTATGTITDNGGGNNHSNAVENGYVSADYWKYQLKDDSELIDKTGAIDIADYMTMAGHDKDISGSSRVRNGLVDFGCFETWNITADTEITAADKPSRNHVVYVREGNELSIDGDALVYAGEATAFNPGFLLLESGSGLLANGNYVGLTNFAMERTIPADGTALTYVPFLIDKMDNASGATFQRYDGATRATYDYKYSATKGAWVDVDPATAVGGVQAFAINGSAGTKVRFYGTSYKETPNDVKTVQLMKFNFNDPWTTNANGTINPNASKQFTHKENMSWNMFGSPYLHAMNYKDMEYGRVIYTGASYDTKNTADSNTSGSVAMGEGVFTQTATLQDYETFTVAAPKAGTVSGGLRGLLVTVAPADAEEADDFIQLKAVESEEASSEFNIAADGVKWMSDDASVAQIYMARNGGRYSMLSALDINGAVSLGLTIPQAAAYTIAIDEEAWMDEYETVVLEDKATGQMVDLLEGAYQFQAPEAGTVEDRFSIRFNRIVDGLGDNVKAYSPSAGMIRVEGAAAGSLVRIYDLNGRCIRVGETPAGNYDVNVGPKGIYLVEVQQKEAEPVVKKVQVK